MRSDAAAPAVDVRRDPTAAPAEGAIVARLVPSFFRSGLSAPSLVETLIDASGGTRCGFALAAAWLALLVVTTSVLALAAPRSKGETQPPTPMTRLPIVLVTLVLIRTAFVLAHFELHSDDFFQLVAARVRGPFADDSLRLVGVSALFHFASWMSDPTLLFVAVNGAALALGAACVHVLARRSGASRDEAWVAASLFACAPGVRDLASWGVGAQQLEAIAIVLGALVAVDGAARDRARRAPLLGTAVCLVTLGVFVKYPVMAVIPPLAALTWWRIDRSPRAAGFVALLLAGALAVPLALAHPYRSASGELDKLGVTRLGENVAFAGSTLFRLTIVAIAAMGVLALCRRTSWRAALRPRELSYGALFVVVSLVPFVLNARYFERYYLILPSAFLALAVAPAIAASASSANLARTFVAALMLANVPEVLAHPGQRPVDAIAHEVRRASTLASPPSIVALVAECEPGVIDASAAHQLDEAFRERDARDGLRWATRGWDADVRIGRAELASDRDAVVYRWCDGRAWREVELSPPLWFEARRPEGAPAAPRTLLGMPVGTHTPGLVLLWVEHAIASLENVGAERARARRDDADVVLSHLAHRLEDDQDVLDVPIEQLDPTRRALTIRGVRYVLALRALLLAFERGRESEITDATRELAARGRDVIEQDGEASWPEPEPPDRAALAGTQHRFLYDAWSGPFADCDLDRTEESIYCVPDGMTIARSDWHYADDGARCGSAVLAVARDGPSCVRVRTRLAGCGTCEERGHLRYRLELVTEP